MTTNAAQTKSFLEMPDANTLRSFGVDVQPDPREQIFTADTLEEAFPNVDAGVTPLGTRILVQIRRGKRVTASGIRLSSETTDTDKWNMAVAKIIALGPLAFRKRDTLDPWIEGIWVQVGDFARVPRFGGDRWDVAVPGDDSNDPVMFAIFNDHEVIGKITGDPLKVRAYV